MNFYLTKWIFPIKEKIILSDNPAISLDNPRKEEIEYVSHLISTHYHIKCEGLFPPKAESEYVSLDSILLDFKSNYTKFDPYINMIFSEYDSNNIFNFLSRIWVIARFDDEGAEDEIRDMHLEMRKNNEIGFVLLDEENPLIVNSSFIRDYMSLISLLINTNFKEFVGYPILISSDQNGLSESIIDENSFRLAIINFFINSRNTNSLGKSGLGEWDFFPVIRDHIKLVSNSIINLYISGHKDLISYIGNILRIVEYNAKDTLVKFSFLMSLLELLLTHNPNYARFNVEDSINKQFSLKVSIVLRMKFPEIDITSLSKRLKQLYNLRSAIAHGNFEYIAKYRSNLCKEEGKEEYLDDIITDVYFYLRVVLELFMDDPDYILFLKES